MNNPTWPIYTFKVNLIDPRRKAWSLPNNIEPEGNETVSEASVIPSTFTGWLAQLLPGFEFITLHQNGTFTAYGAKATYLKNIYVQADGQGALSIVS
jgi:hypothetical protein